MRELPMRTAKPVAKTSELSSTLEGLQIDKSYVFSVAARNSIGQSEFVETKPVSTKLAFGAPSSPKNVRAKLTPEKGLPADQLVELSWVQPIEVSSTQESKPQFLVEMKQEGTDRWIPVSLAAPITDTNINVPLEMMAEGANYQFRVAAKNIAGISPFSTPSPRFQKPFDVAFTKELTDAHLEKLPNDALFECEVSKPGMTLLWFKNGVEIQPDYRFIYEIVGEGPLANMVHRLKVLNVGPGDQGVYTAQLINGLTSASQLTVHSPPKINYEGRELLTIASEKSTIVEVPFSGAPAPKVNWSFNGGKLPLGKNVDKPMASIQTVYGLTSLQLRRVDHTVEGCYLVQVSNEFGKADLELKVQVLDVPQPVENLRAEMIKGEPMSAMVTWEPPKKDGGMPITDYILEKREGSKRTWTPVGNPSMEISRKVTDLKPGQSYFFRVLAQNANGWSDPAEMDLPLRVKAASNPPNTPNAPKVEDVTSTSCKLTIEPPTFDGGAPITFYHLEKRANRKENWVRATNSKLPVSDPAKPHTVSLTDLIPDNVYEFRVAAENADALTSDFSIPSSRISTKPPFNAPGRPSKPEVTIATENSATITWNPPHDDGGDKVKRYVVQYKATDGTHWATCEEEPIDCLMTITKLQPDSEYEFRVAAVNSVGAGEFSHPSQPYTPEKAIESAKPSILHPLENVTISVSTPLELKCDFKLGEPRAKIAWFKDDKPVRKFTTSSPTERHATLKTNRAQLEDAGIFTCRAENAAGSISTTCRVTVIHKPSVKLEHPRGSSEKVNGRISDGKLTGSAQGRLVVEALCEAVPACEELMWLHNGQPLEETHRRLIERGLGDVHPKERPISPMRTRERLVISALEHSDTGVYRVEAKGPAGRADAAFTLVVIDKPQPPASINVMKTRETDSCFIQWHRPISDGGSKLKQYVVESLTVATDRTEAAPMLDTNWTIIGKTLPSELEFKARNLKPGILYAFRVSAENEVGRSEPIEIDTPIVLQSQLQLPSEPINVVATRGGDREATVKWEPPESPDKRDLIGYVVEARESSDIKSSPPNRWTRIGPSTVRDATKLRLTDLNPSMDIQFRVLTRTHAGLSEPSEPTEWLIKPEPKTSYERTSPTQVHKVDGSSKDITDMTSEDRRPKDIVEQVREFREAIKPKAPSTNEPPKIEITADKLFKCREGTNLRVPLSVKSPVQASVELELESGRPLSNEASLRSLVEQYGDSYYVNLKNLALTDTGHYRIKATNVVGSSHAPFELVVIAPPQTPRGPIEVREIKLAKGIYDGNTVEVSWKVPALREGETLETAVIGYVIERKDGKRKDFGRPIKVQGPNTCTAVVEDLQPGVEYGFKVCAFNSAGMSEPLYSGPVTIKSPFDVPGTCKGPLKCTDKSATSLVLNWQPPEKNGGLPIKKYHIERNEVGSSDGWQPLAIVMAPTTSCPVSDLREGIPYRFRVRAINDQGNGEWLNTESSISLNRPIGPPSEPEKPLRVTPVDDTSANLSWRSPHDDGGSPVTGYIVEASRESTDQWENLGVIKDTAFKVTKLIPDDTYTFRVSALNEAGKTGEPLYSVPYRPSAPPTAPGKPAAPIISHPLEAGQMVLDWGPSPFGGTSGYGPPSEYHIERWEPMKDRWVHVARKPATDGTTVLVTGLRPGESYKFRVFAENTAGISEPLEMDKPVLAVSPYSPPSAPVGPMHISEVQKGESAADGSARLSWQEPTDDGGIPLTGYIVQMRYANTTAWHKVVHLHEPTVDEDTDVILPTTTPVIGLKRSNGYYFRVAAINRAGTGPFLESELFEMPEDESCRPKAEWIRVVGKGSDSVTVEWLVPHDCRKDHGPHIPHHLALDGFRVYVKAAEIPNAEWKAVADLDHYMNRLVVGGLSPDKRYYFGVAAVNQLGPGEIVSTTEPVSPEAVTTVPGQPIGPLVVSDITQDSCVLSWKAPYSDGGTPITGYTIFKREMFRRSNQEVGRIPVVPGSLQRAFEFKVPYLMEGTSYEFQVVAENKNGFSEPLVTAADVHPRKMTEPPGAPRGPLYVRDHDIGQVELAWGPPVNTGDLPIKGYKLELREGRSFTWRTYPNEESMVSNQPEELANPSVVVSGIKPNKEYFFRVSAINSDGCGPPLTAADSYVKRVRLEPPKRVTAKLASPSESGPGKVEVTWISPDVPTLSGFTVEMMDTEDVRSEWVPMDFIPKMPNESGNTAYTYRATAPRPKSVYKFRVNAVYPESKSDWIETNFVLASEPTKESRIPPPIIEAKFVPSTATPGGKIPATLRWETPASGDVDSIRGYTVESWDIKRRTWKPVAHIPKEAPRELTFELPPACSTPLMRITSMGDATRSTPFEVPLERAKRIERTGEIPGDWKPLPSVTGPIGPEYNADEELSMIRTGAATPFVSEFILQRRQAALDMIRRSTATPRSAGLDTIPLERFFAETPLVETLDLPQSSSTPHPLDRLRVTDIGKTTATVEWPEIADQSGFTVERWRPTSGRWTRLAEVPPSETRYVVPLSEIPRTAPSDEAPINVWVRVVPRDAEGRPSAPPFQLEKPITLPGGEFVPSSVWGVDISPVGGLSTPGRPVDVSWRPPSFTGGLPLTGYKLVITNADTEEQKSVFVEPKTTTYRLEGLNPQHEYRVSITAVNRIGESMTVTSTVPKPPTIEDHLRRPPAPTSVELVPVSGGSPESKSGLLSWRPGSRTGASPTNSYVIEKWDSCSKQWVPFKKVGKEVTEITIPYLLNDVMYAFRVRAQNEAGLSEPGIAKEYFSPGKPLEELLFPAEKAPPAPPRGPLAYEPLTSKQRFDLATEKAMKIMEFHWEEPIMTDRFSIPRSYILEARRGGQQKWAMVGRRPIPEGSRWKVAFGPSPPTMMPMPDIDMSLPSLPMLPPAEPRISWLPGEPKDYEYRLSSENEYGFSEPIYLRPSVIPDLSRLYSPIKPFVKELVKPAEIEPPRGPISIARLPSRPMSHRGPFAPDLQLGPKPLPDVLISWKPPLSTQNIRGYEITYREPFRTTWTHLGMVDAENTSFRIPRIVLRELPEAIHLGISSVGDRHTRTTPYLSPRLEDTILIPKSTEEEISPREELATPISSAYVSARVKDRPSMGVTPSGEVEVSWTFPEARRQLKRPEGYIAFYRELGSQQWQEIDRFPVGRPKDTVVLRELPRGTAMFIGVAPLVSGRIGQIVSTPDTVRLPGREAKETPKPLFERKPLQIRPMSPGGIEVSWAPPATINDLLSLSPGKVPKYELQVRHPEERLWRPIGRPELSESLRRPSIGEQPVAFHLHDLHPGDRLELRLLAYSDLGKKPVQVSAEQTYKFISPYDIPSAPRGPLMVERRPVLPSRLPTLSPLRKSAGDFDELLYRLSTFPGAPVTPKFHERRETPTDLVNLSWRPPDDTGGLPITHYLIEQRSYDHRGLPAPWVPVMTVPAGQTSVQLQPDTRRFKAEPSLYRVRAVNVVGPGLPLEALEPITLTTRDKSLVVGKESIQHLPEAPLGPLRAEILPDSMVCLSWEAPRRWLGYSPRQSEGVRTPVYPQKYIIEATLADDSTMPWLEVGKVPGSVTTATVRMPSLSLFRPGSSVETPSSRPILYRVRAENEYGYSAPLTTRVRPDFKLQASLSKLPKLPDVPVRARILEPLEEYEVGVPPSIKLEWAPFTPPALIPGASDRTPSVDYSYQVEYRPAGDLGWRHLATLPLGHERYTFYPPAPSFRNLEQPKSEAFQFRVGVRGPIGVGEFRDSNIVSWNYRIRTPRSVPFSNLEPILTSRAPLDFELVRTKVDTPREPYTTPTGSISLKWRVPSYDRISAPESYVVERWIPETGTWRTLSHKLEGYGHGIFETTVHSLPIDEPHFIRVSSVGHMGTSEPATLPYPIWIPVTAPTTRSAAPEPPRNLEVTPILRDRPGFLLTWTPPEVPVSRRTTKIPTLPSGYFVEYRPVGGEWKLLADLPAWQTDLETTKVELGKSYDFRVMSKGRLESVPLTPSARRPSRSVYPETSPAAMSKPAVSGPHTLPKQLVPPPSISGLLDVIPTREGMQLSWEPPRELPSGYVIELRSLDDQRHVWRTVTRIPSVDRGLPISSFLIRYLEADKSYRFRVIPYQDEIYGRPVESLVPYRVPLADELGFHLTQRPRTIPPPCGPVTIEELPSGLFRLGWRPPAVDLRMPTPGPIMYVVEQRIPGRRQWVEIGRTPNLSYTIDLDTTSQFRIKTLVGEPSNILRGAEYLVGSDDGPQSDWIRLEERILETTKTDMVRRLPRDSTVKVEQIAIPKRLFARHVGPSSVLLEWEYPKLPDHPTGYLYLEQRLVPDSKTDFVQPLWEPIARIPISSLKTSYEVSDLSPGHSYLFRLVGKYGGSRASLKQSEISLPKPIRTRGGDLRSTNLPKDMDYLMIPRSFTATFNRTPSGGLRFTWLPPESLESQTSKIRYRIEVRSVHDRANAWRLLAKDIKGTEYALDATEFERSLFLHRPAKGIPKTDSTDWHFRIIATVDGVDSHPKLLSSPLSITTESERKKLRFLNVDKNCDIKCVLGQTLVIVFEVEGSPKPSVSWFLNGVTIYPEIDSNYLVVSKSPGIYELRINNINYIHEGIITCKARNFYEEIEQSWRIHIDAPIRFSRTVFLAGQSDHRVTSGGNWNVRLPLDVPYHVTDRSHWVHRTWVECIWKPRSASPDIVLPAERRAVVKISDCGRWLILDLPGVRVQDEGLYRVWIENEAGRDYFDLRLYVDDKPRAKLQPPNIFPQGHSHFLLSWQPPSSTDDTITSTGYRIEYISDKQLDAEENWQLLGTTGINQTEVLIGPQLKIGERYRFRVRLQNLLGLGPASEPSRFICVETTEDEAEDRTISRRRYSREPIRFSSRKFEDRYEIIEELAKSRHAYLYRIRDRETGEYRIAKIMDLGDLSYIPVSRSYTSLADFRSSVYTPSTRIRHEAEEDRRLRAERELKLLASTHHKNIAELRDVFVDAQRLIWVIGDMTPETLWDQIKNRIRMTEFRAALIMKQILSLMESLHDRNVAFLGGVDPSDIFFTDKLRRDIVLGGVSEYHKLTEDKPVRLTFRSTIYVPPELYSSDRLSTNIRPQAEISRATDVWSAGALLYQMLTGDTEHRPSVEALEKLNLSPELLDFSRKLLHPDPTLRPTIAEALRHPWITTEHKTTEDIISQSARRLEEATSNAYKRLLRKIDWSEGLDEEDNDFVDEMEHEIRKRRRLTEYRKRRRMSLDEYDKERDYEDDEGIAMNVFLRGRGRVPRIAVPMANADAYEGSDTVMKCVLAPPAGERLDLNDVTVEWSVNGKVIDLDHPSLRMTEKYAAKFDRSTGEATLRVKNLSVYDAGTYVATFRGRFGITSESANLKIYRETAQRPTSRETDTSMASEIGAKILRPLVDHTVVAGESLKFRIRVGGIPRPKCTWTRNGLSLDNDPTCRIQEELVSTSISRSNEIICTFEIRNMKLSDAGIYSVNAYNKNGSDSCSASVTVLPERTSGSSVPKFITGLSNTSTVTGGTATLEAEVEGFPEPQIRWFKDGRMVVVGGHITTTATETNSMNRLTCRLVITGCQLEDTGAYVCAATSASGTAISEATVIVKGAFMSSTTRRDSESRLSITRCHPPEFVQRLKSRVVTLGNSVRLSASIMATPPASITWEKDDIPLITDSANSPYQTKNLNGNVELRIEKCTASELGKYTLIAYNSAGEARCSCQLEKAREEVFKVPCFVRQLVDRYLISGQKAILEVIAEGHPIPEFKWEKDGLDIRQESHPRYIFSASATSGRATLTIPVVERDDAGLYSCVAHNPVGRDRCSCLIYVDGGGVQQRKSTSSASTSITDTDKRPPQPPKVQPATTPGQIEVVTSLPAVLEINEGDELRLFCIVKSDVHLIPTWTKAGRTLAFDGRRRITRNLMGEMCLTIDQAMTTDAGRYTLTVAPSDATLAETMKPVVLNTRVEVNPKIRSRTRISSQMETQERSRSTRSWSRRESSYTYSRSSRERSFLR
ncbi:Titin [Echinococcus granulosus]|nr:Titin [Echinococcus granulosus]EUB61845.1 Titin [Echinococcus granulosus]